MRLAMWIGLGFLAALAAGYFALQFAIGRDGAAVLDTIDRLAAGNRGIAIVERARYGTSPKQRLLVLRKRGAGQGLPVMVFIHGGSWARGKPESYAFAGRTFAEHGFLAVVAGYRLYPDARYPAMLEDAAMAVAWARRNARRLGGDQCDGRSPVVGDFDDFAQQRAERLVCGRSGGRDRQTHHQPGDQYRFRIGATDLPSYLLVGERL